MSPEKGQVDFIRAAADVVNKCESAKFVLIGRGDDELCLRNLARKLEIANADILAGYRDDMASI